MTVDSSDNHITHLVNEAGHFRVWTWVTGNDYDSKGYMIGAFKTNNAIELPKV